MEIRSTFKGTMLTVRRDLPETVVGALAGRRLADIVDLDQLLEPVARTDPGTAADLAGHLDRLVIASASWKPDTVKTTSSGTRVRSLDMTRGGEPGAGLTMVLEPTRWIPYDRAPQGPFADAIAAAMASVEEVH